MTNKDIIERVLKEKPQFQDLLFAGGYLITDLKNIPSGKYPFFGKWNSVLVNDYHILFHTKHKVHQYKTGRITFLLIGHAYNPFQMVADESQILKQCSDSYAKSKEDFLDYISELTGIHLILVFEDRKILAVQDCTGMKSCYYGKTREHVFLTSHCQLVDDLVGLTNDKMVERLLKSASYRRGSKYLPGDLTPFSELRRLGPNTYLNYDGEFSIRRFYPSSAHPEFMVSEGREVFERIAELLRNNLKLCAKKWERPAISLSGGVDSRTTLAAANGLYDRFKNYSFHCKQQELNDATTAHSICDVLGLPHSIYPIPEQNEDIPDFDIYRSIISHNSAYVSVPGDHEIRKYAFLSKLKAFDVELKSWASEIGRAFWERRYGLLFPKRLIPRHFSIFQSRYLFAPILQIWSDAEYKDYLERSELVSSPYNYEHSDLFYWEFRFGSWGTIVTQGQEVFGFEVTMPLNNRKLMDMFLWFEHNFRKRDGVNKEVTRINNEKISSLNLNVHNDYLNSKRTLMEKAFYYLKIPFWHWR